jgi:hypothetical protein
VTRLSRRLAALEARVRAPEPEEVLEFHTPQPQARRGPRSLPATSTKAARSQEQLQSGQHQLGRQR